MKLRYLNVIMGLVIICLASCNDFLDQTPEGDITPQKYFSSEADLAAFTVNYYNFRSIPPYAYALSYWGDDNDTDNQAAMNYSSRWAPGEWKVPSSGGQWDFSRIRHINYFLEQTMEKYKVNQIQGNDANIRHYIGEAHVMRAYEYIKKLQNLGDCPIVTSALSDNKEALIAASKRQPSYKVARFILNDLDTAITMLKDTPPQGGKCRIGKDVAYLLRSRAALFEGTWLKYHKGTAFVPGGTGWPGNSEDIQGFNIDDEIKYFLSESMKSAKVVGDRVVDNLVVNTDTQEGMDASFNVINPYYCMFCDENMENYSEILMWRSYSVAEGITHNVQLCLENDGGGSGWTRGLVNSFLMRNGLPIYASGSGYNSDWEKAGVAATLKDRDSRIQLFTKKDGDIEDYHTDGTANHVDYTWIAKGISENRMVTGFPIKKGKHYSPVMRIQHDHGTSGSVVFRATEAMLNYMEASYELNGNIDATCDKYWRALRVRAKVNPDYKVTIAATSMNEEAKGDWGAYSHGMLIDPTLYNIRRERRNEFIGEGLRWADLCRWRALDQVRNYQIEGIRYWGSIYEGNLRSNVDGKIVDLVKVDEIGGTGNMSSKDRSVYIRPYQISKVNNSVFDGYNFTPAHYLYPIAQSVFRQTASGDQTDLNTSVVYQNPGWPKVADQGPNEIR